MNGLSSWYVDLLARIKELEGWTSDFNLPNSVWLSGFFNPQSFLTAIMQSTARKNELPLDKMCLVCEVTKKSKEEVTQPPKEGAFTHGLYMEVFLFNQANSKHFSSTGCSMGYKHQLYSRLQAEGALPYNASYVYQGSNSGEHQQHQSAERNPFIISQDKQELRNLYECPVYKTRERGKLLSNETKYLILKWQAIATSGHSTSEQEKNHPSGFWLGWHFSCKYDSFNEITNTV